MGFQVYKFGGASVQNAEGVKNLVKVLEQTQVEDLVIVISAMGKMTNALEDVVALMPMLKPIPSRPLKLFITILL